MLVLRLVRTGRRNQPKFRLVAAEQGKKVKGAVVEIIGHYEPTAPTKPFVFDKEKTQHWVSKGALVSNTVAKLLNKEGFSLPVHQYAEAKPKKKAQAKLDEANKPKESAPVAAEAASDESPAVETTDAGSDVESSTEAVEVASAEEPVAETPVVEPVSSDDDPGKETSVEEAPSEAGRPAEEAPAEAESNQEENPN